MTARVTAVVALIMGAACTSPLAIPSGSSEEPTGLDSSPHSSVQASPLATGSTGYAPPTPSTTSNASTEVLLRLTVYEGPSPQVVIEPPEFTLYADGRAIYAIKTRAPDETWDTVELHSAQLSPQQVETLVGFALDDGGLRDARSEYANISNLSDLGWHYFDVNADSVEKQVRVHGLSYEAGWPARDAAHFAEIAALAELLENFAAEVEAGRATDRGAFAPEAYEATLSPGRDDVGTEVAWPWPEIDASDFGAEPDGTPVRRLTRAQGEAVLGLGVDQFMMADAPDGNRYSIHIRPLLPDEVD